MALFSKQKLESVSDRIWEYRHDWTMEVPMRIHGYGVDDGHGLGGPPLHPEFERWLGPICFCGRKQVIDAKGNIITKGCPSTRVPRASDRRYQTDSRLRTTKAFRKLRKVAPREFDALYLMTAHQASFEVMLGSLRDRAARLGKPTYSATDALLLVVLAVDKVESWW